MCDSWLHWLTNCVRWISRFDWIVDRLPYQLLLHDRAPKPLFQFRPSDWFGFFNALGWSVKETSYFTEAAKRLASRSRVRLRRCSARPHTMTG